MFLCLLPVGCLESNSGMEQWNGIVEWNTGISFNALTVFLLVLCIFLPSKSS